MTDERQYSTGEVYRLCERIEAAVKEQNGRIKKLENDAIRIKTIWTSSVLILGFFADSIRHRLGM